MSEPCVMEEKLKEICQDVKEIHACLYGSPNTPGMRLQLDRLEQAEKRRREHIGYLWGAVSALLAGLVGLFFTPR